MESDGFDVSFLRKGLWKPGNLELMYWLSLAEMNRKFGNVVFCMTQGYLYLLAKIYDTRF